MLDGRGFICSFSRDPEAWYYKEKIEGERRYRTKRIPNATTEEAAVKGAMEVAFSMAQQPVKPVAQPGEPRGRIKKVTIAEAVNQWLDQLQLKVEAGELGTEALRSKKITLARHLVDYLKLEKVKYTSDLTVDSLLGFPAYRMRTGSKSKITRAKELGRIKEFIEKYLIKHNLVNNEVKVSRELTPSVRIRQDELTANPSIIPDDWLTINTFIRKEWRPGANKLATCHVRNSHYWRTCFWTFTMTMKNGGFRPIELRRMKWKDVSYENIGRETSRGTVEDMWIAYLFVRKSKTGVARNVPCNKNVTRRLMYWRSYIDNYFIDRGWTRKVEDDDYIFGRGNNNLEPYHYSRFEDTWRTEIMWPLMQRKELKGNPFSDNPYTIYSMRATFIEEKLLKGMDIHLLSRICGHSIQVLMKHYDRMDVRKRAREITHIDFNRDMRDGLKIQALREL